MSQTHAPADIEWLELLRVSQNALANTINSLDIKAIPNWDVRYLLWASTFVNRTALGYFVLRQSHVKFASKLLVRPILECFLSAQAVLNKRGFLFRKIYTEVSEFRKLDPNTTDAEFRRAIAKYVNEFKAYDRLYPCVEKQVSMSYTAEVAQMVDYYELWYRLYCKYTHGSQIAVTGTLDEVLDVLDTPFVTYLVLRTLEHLEKHNSIKSVGLAGLVDKYNELSRKLKGGSAPAIKK